VNEIITGIKIAFKFYKSLIINEVQTLS